MSEYLGILPRESTENALINNSILKSRTKYGIPAVYFFFQKYKAYPIVLNCNYVADKMYVSHSHAMAILKEEYGHNSDYDIVNLTRLRKKDVVYAITQVSDIGNGVMIEFTNGDRLEDLVPLSMKNGYTTAEKFHNVFYWCKIYYLPQKLSTVKEILKSLNSALFVHSDSATLQMICKNKYRFYLTPIRIKKPMITDLKLHYGDEFENVHNTIMEALKNDNAHGLVLLHGLPGSGKTHYIRYLIQEITKKELIYIPPEMASLISSPEFFPFMLEQKDSILIIEDAENILKSREETTSTSQSVANLLNLSDGLLGDSLHQPIIATFNCELNSIDTALLRKGRLIAKHEFGKLSIENARKLSNKLGFSNQINEPMTLAEIYSQEKD